MLNILITDQKPRNSNSEGKRETVRVIAVGFHVKTDSY